ncbi:hypothetical protein QQF64_021285 [Cirrhinus molitorella]|uniref:Uncharacterized protein n=1 Tax=Cirrhinus molitorella TaxID=172907 RepID=A0ABR3LBJ5_9TELE
MTTACEEDLADGRKPWAMRHRDRERATVGSPHQEVGSQRERAVCPCPSGTARRERGALPVDIGISIGRSTWNTCVQRTQRDQFRTETQYQAGNEQRLLINAVGFYLSLHQQPSALCLRIVMQIKSLARELIRRPLISERFVSQTEESLAEGTQRGPPG